MTANPALVRPNKPILSPIFRKFSITAMTNATPITAPATEPEPPTMSIVSIVKVNVK